MNELTPSGRELIAAARRERSPNAGDRARVLSALLASAAASGAAAPVKASGSVASRGAAQVSFGLAKTLLVGVLTMTGVYLWSTQAHAPKPHHGVELPAQAVAPSKAAAPPQPQLVSSAIPESSTALPTPNLATGSSNSAKATNALDGAATPSSLERELSLLQRAHEAYRAGQPGAALALAREHGRIFPRSQLSAARRTIEVLALCQLGRTNEAKSLAGRLRAESGAAALTAFDGSCVSR